MPRPRRVFLSPPHLDGAERQFVLDAIDSNYVAPVGPHVDAFEREFASRVGARHAVAVSSGTAALHLAMVAAGVRPGDSVIVPTLTFVATANAVRHAGATPIFVDCDPGTWTIDPELVDRTAARLASSGRRATAVTPVDAFGQCADYDALREVCDRHGMALVADAAESLGATYRDASAGSAADLACFSFNGNKIITTSGGGMVVTQRSDWSDRVRRLASQSRSPGPEYHHEEVGYNYRLSNLLAALGRAQLARLDDRVGKLRSLNAAYREGLADERDLTFMPRAAYGEPTWWLTCVLFDPALGPDARERTRLALEAENIESRPLWKPMHLQPAHRASVTTRDPDGAATHAERLWRHGLCLPSGTSLTDEDQQRVIAVVRESLRASRRRAA